jgi:hypothetical protein
MNERIDKLFEQALEEFTAENKYATIIVPDPLKEKFAELIIKECVREFVRKTPVSVNVSNRARHVFKHFGVEE